MTLLCKIKGLILSLPMLVICTPFVAKAENAVQVTSAKTLEMHYSHARLELTLQYDGSLGNATSYGVVALTNDNVQGTGFKPYAMSKGENTVVIEVLRPMVFHSRAFQSDRLDIQAYSRNVSKHALFAYTIHWPAFAEKYQGVLHQPQDQTFTYLAHVLINEALPKSASVIKALHYFGIADGQMKIAFKPLSNPKNRDIALRVTEGVALEDVKLLITIIETEGLHVANINFEPLSEDSPYHASASILEGYTEAVGAESAELISVIKRANNLAEVYQAAHFVPRQVALSYEDRIAKVNALIKIGGPFQLQEARRELAALISHGDWKPELLVAYSRLLMKQIKLPLEYAGLLLVALYLLGHWIYKRYIRMPEWDTVKIDVQDPSWKHAIATAQTRIDQLLAGIREGKDEAFVYIPIPVENDILHFWAVVHHQQDNQLLVSVEQAGMKGLAGRRKVSIDEVQDWILEDDAGNIRGGFTFFAILTLYKAKYGRLPKRHKKALAAYQDLSIDAL